MEQGPCNGTFENWFFEKESDTCRPFLYGGCKGNDNRYATESACNYHCKRPGVQKSKRDLIGNVTLVFQFGLNWVFGVGSSN